MLGAVYKAVLTFEGIWTVTILQHLTSVSQAHATRHSPPCCACCCPALPVCCMHACLPCSTTAEQLEAAADQLLAHCQAGLPAPVSYNVILTQELMLMVPRKQESCGRIAIK
jgi:hypothetical protein